MQYIEQKSVIEKHRHEYQVYNEEPQISNLLVPSLPLAIKTLWRLKKCH